MADYNMMILKPDATLVEIQSYIRGMVEQIGYCFSNIEPEENFSDQAYVDYEEKYGSTASLAMSLDGFKQEFNDAIEEFTRSAEMTLDGAKFKVKKQDLCSEISIQNESISFATGNIVIDTDNFKLNSDGTAVFSGSITGGSININHNFVVDSNGNVSNFAVSASKYLQCNNTTASRCQVLNDGHFYDVNCATASINYDMYAYGGVN